MKSVIITGADGFVASHVVGKFIQEGYSVLALSRSAEPKRLTPNARLSYIACDCLDVDSLRAAIPVQPYELFIHMAWDGITGAAREDFGLQMQNAQGTVECMKLAKELGCKRFMVAGSFMEYEVEVSTHAQGCAPSKTHIYSVGKQMAHEFCKMMATDLGIDLLWPMITNAYGEGEYSARFINTTLRKMHSREELTFSAATQNYDFIYVTDVAEAFYLIAERGKNLCEYVIGSGEARPLKDFILTMADEFAQGQELHFGAVPQNGISVPIDFFNIDALRNDCQWQPQVSFVDGIHRTMDYLLSLRGGYRLNLYQGAQQWPYSCEVAA